MNFKVSCLYTGMHTDEQVCVHASLCLLITLFYLFSDDRENIHALSEKHQQIRCMRFCNHLGFCCQIIVKGLCILRSQENTRFLLYERCLNNAYHPEGLQTCVKNSAFPEAQSTMFVSLQRWDILSGMREPFVGVSTYMILLIHFWLTQKGTLLCKSAYVRMGSNPNRFSVYLIFWVGLEKK